MQHYASFIADNERFAVVEVIASKHKALVEDDHLELFRVVIADCNQFFSALRSIRNKVLSFDLYPLTISPKYKLFNRLSLPIKEGQLMTNRGVFVL